MASPSRLESAFQLALKYLSEAGVGCALVGGLAVSARTKPRFTQDIDLAVAVAGDAQAQQLGRFMLDSGYEIATDIEQTGVDRLSTIRLVRSEEKHVFIDLLFASSGIEQEIVQDADRLEALGTEVKVATIAHLIATKLLSRDDATRPQDRQDLVHLLNAASDKDMEDVDKALRLIEERGFNRTRNLLQELERTRRDFGLPG